MPFQHLFLYILYEDIFLIVIMLRLFLRGYNAQKTYRLMAISLVGCYKE